MKLYGYWRSSAAYRVRIALNLKGISAEQLSVHLVRDGGEQHKAAYTALNPLELVPTLTLDDELDMDALSQSLAIIEYLDEIHPQTPLLPASALERAQVRAMAKEIELYIELPARLCYAEVIFGGRPTPEALKRKAERDMIKGFSTLSRRAKFAPYVMGEQFTVADLYFLYSVDLAALVAKKLFDIDVLADMPQARALLALLANNPNVQRVAAERMEDIPLFLERIKIA